jgi:hypothetical protein
VVNTYSTSRNMGSLTCMFGLLLILCCHNMHAETLAVFTYLYTTSTLLFVGVLILLHHACFYV